LDKRASQTAGDGPVWVEAAFAVVEIEDWAGEACVAGKEPVAPFGGGGECAGGEVAGEVRGELGADGLGAPADVGLVGLWQGCEALLEAAGVPRGDGKGTAAAIVAAGAAGEPGTGAVTSFSEGGVDGGQDANFHALFVRRDHLRNVLEIFSIFFIFALFYGVAVYGWVREGLRERRRARILDAALLALLGEDVHRARDLMGEPSKIEFGMSGRRLYIWRPPATLALPETPALTVVTLTVEANDMVSATSWKAD